MMHVKDINQVAKSFKCDTCNMMFSAGFRLNEHMSNCTALVKDTFSKYGELYRPTDNVVIQVAKMLGVYAEGAIDFAYDYFAVYDYESILKAYSGPVTAKVVKTTTHIPVSCSVNSNLPDTVKFFCVLDYATAFDMNKAIWQYFLDIQEIAHGLMRQKMERQFGMPFEALIDLIKLTNPRLALGLISYVKQLPVLNYNGSSYDINLNKSHGLLSLMASDNIQFSAKKANKYMSIGTDHIKMLDITSYLTPGVSYDEYCEAYGCNMKKGFFPYEWCDDEKKLLETQLPPSEAFHSKLRSSNSLGGDAKEIKLNYAMLQQVWIDNGMSTMRDFIQWYNNLDVIPFVEAISKQKAFYLEHELDMFKDAISIPGLAEKIMFREARVSAAKMPKPDKHKWARVSSKLINTRIAGYKEQDAEAGRAYDAADYLDSEHAYELLEEANYRCHYCYTSISENKTQNVEAARAYDGTPEGSPRRDPSALSYDRIDCSLAHIKGNLKVACNHCNTSRSDTNYNAFYARSEMKRLNAVSPQVKLISEKNKEVFYKLKQNVVGGPSIVFARYHEAGKTHIRHPVYNAETKDWSVVDGKIVNRVLGFDANALYLWCLNQSMPCGEMKEIPVTDNMIEQIKAGELFGFAEVDIETPEHLFNKFSEFPPIFRNAVITEDQLGPYMKELRKDLNNPISDNKKLISSYTGTKILLYTPLLKWYLEHGLVVTKVHSFISAIENQPFKSFTDKVSDNRRSGDVDESKKIIADTWKLTGNSAFGRTGMDKNRHTNTKYLEDIYKAKRKVNNWLFKDLNEIETIGGDTLFEVMSAKKSIKQNCPIQVASAVYSLAKLRMLQFYHDCLDKFVDRSDFALVQMDTDSLYMGITGESIETMIKPEMQAQFELEKYDWFPDNTTEESAAFNKRVPGLFKVEWNDGHGMVALTSKMYFCQVKSIEARMKASATKNKSSAKGIQERNNQSLLTFEKYKEALDGRKVLEAHNRGFRVWDAKVYTYEQSKNGLSPIYDKRIVLEDGVTTIPIGAVMWYWSVVASPPDPLCQ